MSDCIKYEVRVYRKGDRYWYLNGALHREDGPAVECSSGHKAWYLNGERHRVDGPAIECADGEKHWYLNGKYYTESNYKEEMKRRNNSRHGKTAVIDGKQYTLNAVDDKQLKERHRSIIINTCNVVGCKDCDLKWEGGCASSYLQEQIMEIE